MQINTLKITNDHVYLEVLGGTYKETMQFLEDQGIDIKDKTLEIYYTYRPEITFTTTACIPIDMPQKENFVFRQGFL